MTRRRAFTDEQSCGYDPYDHAPAEWKRYRVWWSASEIAAMKANALASWTTPLVDRRREYVAAIASGNRVHTINTTRPQRYT